MRQINPIEDIKEASEKQNFFIAFVLAATYFEYETNLILRAYFKGKIKRETLGKWSVALKIKRIFGLNLINRETCEQITGIISIRNKLVHPSGIWSKEKMRSHNVFLQYRLTSEEKTRLSHFADCYRMLVVAHSKTLKNESLA